LASSARTKKKEKLKFFRKEAKSMDPTAGFDMEMDDVEAVEPPQPVMFPLPPSRVYKKPMWVWTEACAKAEERRWNTLCLFEKNLLDDAQRMVVARTLFEHAHWFPREITRLAFQPVLVFDTETTGLSASDIVIQLGYVLMLSDGTVLSEYEKILRGDIPSNPFALKVHRIKNQTVRSSPYDIEEELTAFLALAHRVTSLGGRLVAHNAKFDVRLLQQTAAAVGMQDFDVGEVFCTATKLKRVPTAERGATCKNADVYRVLGGPDMDMHHALNDAKATAFIYKQGIQSGWW
jgi:DNA polymerase III epsilon subunit-like protein